MGTGSGWETGCPGAKGVLKCCGCTGVSTCSQLCGAGGKQAKTTTHKDGAGKCDISPVQMALLIIKPHPKDSQGAKARVFCLSREGDGADLPVLEFEPASSRTQRLLGSEGCPSKWPPKGWGGQRPGRPGKKGRTVLWLICMCKHARRRMQMSSLPFGEFFFSLFEALPLVCWD